MISALDLRHASIRWTARMEHWPVLRLWIAANVYFGI
jgi:hypothetical protein